MKLTTLFLAAFGILAAQQPPVPDSQIPLFHASVTARTMKAVNYQHRSGATKIDFRGTDVLPGSSGQAKVESKQGYIEVEVEFRNLKPASVNGAEYLTYVLWAITPDGRTSNLGEILLNGTSSKLDVTTQLQVFGLLVTAEPYYAVNRPSDLIVMENVVRPDTVGKVEEVEAKYELLQRGHYQRLSNPLALKVDRRIPLELYEARNAVQIARSVGSAGFASDTFVKAEKSLAQAEAYQTRNAGRKPVTMTAREAVEIAEDARAIAVKRQEEDILAAEKRQLLDRQMVAENGRAAAQSEADRVKRDAEAARLTAQSEAERLTREKDAQALAASVEASRLRERNEAAAASAKMEADNLKRENDAQRAASQAELDRASQQKARLETEKAELRVLLLSQFSAILQTRDTARGLIVNMSDVLFDTGKFSLRPLAREKLARVAGIVSGHPGLRLDVEGHTDSVGGDDYNQQLSEQRGSAVKDYLTGQGMAAASVSSKGFGKSQPVASNDTSDGRQQNRRVELVISGDIIGQEIGIPGGAR